MLEDLLEGILQVGVLAVLLILLEIRRLIRGIWLIALVERNVGETILTCKAIHSIWLGATKVLVLLLRKLLLVELLL